MGLTAVALLGLTVVAAADDEIDDTIEQIEQRTLGDTATIPKPGVNVLEYIGTRVKLDQGFIAGTELAHTEILSSRTRLSVEVGAPLSKETAIGFRFGTGVRAFRFDGPGDFIEAGRDAGEPVDELLESSFRTGVRVRVLGDLDLDPDTRLGRLFERMGGLEHDEWEAENGDDDEAVDHDLHLIDSIDFEVVGSVRSQHEEGARFGSAIVGGGSVSFRLRSSDRFDLRLGLGIGSSLDSDQVKLSPVVKLRIRLGDDVWIESEGVGGRIEIDVARGVRLDLAGGISGESYRLEDRRDLPQSGRRAVGQGSLRVKRAEVFTAVHWRLTRQIRLMVSAGCVLEEEWVIANGNGRKVDEAATREPAASVGIGLDWRF